MIGDPNVRPSDDQSELNYSSSISEIFTQFETRSSGLTGDESARRVQKYGKNSLIKPRKKSIYIRFLANFTHLMAILLWVGGIVAFIAHMPQLGIAVWMVNLINGLFLSGRNSEQRKLLMLCFSYYRFMCG
jgi:Cation transport ATPase